MSSTELKVRTIGNERAGTYGSGDLRSILNNDDENWRAAVDIDIEAEDKDEVRRVADAIVERLSELGEIDEMDE